MKKEQQKNKELVNLGEQVDNLATKNKVTKDKEVDRIEVVAMEFNKENANMSPLEQRLLPKNQGLKFISPVTLSSKIL